MPNRVENNVKKGEIACYKQFLFFSQCFLQLHVFIASKCGLCDNGVTLYKDLEEKAPLKILWEKEKMLVTAFSPFPTMFSIIPKSKFECLIHAYFVVSVLVRFRLV